MAHSTPMSAHHMAGRGGVGSQYNSDSHLNREYLVPSRAKVIYDEEEAMTELLRSTENTMHVNNNGDDEDNDSENSDYGSRGGTGGDYDDSGDMSCDSYRCGTFKPKKKRPLNNGLNVEFYYDFCGFLPGMYSFESINDSFINAFLISYCIKKFPILLFLRIKY